ncbi:MAG: MerR family transcriptional regulator [Oligoflexia bacterium]|nr:MerR family transcriptional regulator [Oligoflexia bacterium]
MKDFRWKFIPIDLHTMLRYLEEKGLLVPSRSNSEYRIYCSDDLIKVKRILFFQKLGFSFQEIGKLLDVKVDLLIQKIEELQRKKENLNIHY